MSDHKTEHNFGGAWTELKLDILKKYLGFYTKALKNQQFELLYIDAFAGSGSRSERVPEAPILEKEEEKIEFDGSAKIALNLNHKFDKYLFIENNTERYNELIKLKNKFKNIYIQVKKEDSNKVIQQVCNKPIWSKTSKYRGVIFLDPYGNQVEWKTLEAISSTEAFDLWFLFPISGVYRQASHDYDRIEEYKKENLNKMFGTDSWQEAFYKETGQGVLFGEKQQTERMNVEEIEKWVKNRLEDCFYYVSKPLQLPQTGPQLFSLFFCISNTSPKAKGLALKAANHILKQYEN